MGNEVIVIRIAVCMREDQERELLIKWIRQYCDVYGWSCSVIPSARQEAFFEVHDENPFQLVFLGLGGHEGLHMAQRLRSMDKRCAVVMIDDTTEHAVSGVRLHVSDFMVRPLDFKKVSRAMRLSVGA